MQTPATRPLTVDQQARVEANRQTALHRRQQRQHLLANKLTAVPDAGSQARRSLTVDQLARVAANRQAALARQQQRIQRDLQAHQDAWRAEETLIRAAGFPPVQDPLILSSDDEMYDETGRHRWTVDKEHSPRPIKHLTLCVSPALYDTTDMRKLEALGATVSQTVVSHATTHYVATLADSAEPSDACGFASSKGIPVVCESFVTACLRKGTDVDWLEHRQLEDSYNEAGCAAGAGVKHDRNASTGEDDEDDTKHEHNALTAHSSGVSGTPPRTGHCTEVTSCGPPAHTVSGIPHEEM